MSTTKKVSFINNDPRLSTIKLACFGLAWLGLAWLDLARELITSYTRRHNNIKTKMTGDDDTFDGGSTWASQSLAIQEDGSCPRHPREMLREVGKDGYVYQKESCPACDAEFREQRRVLNDRKKELDRQLQQMGDADELPSLAEDSTAVSADDIDNLRDSLMQHAKVSDGRHRSMTDEEVNHSSSRTKARTMHEDNGYSRPPLTLESLASQMNMMQQMQDWLLREKETEMNILRNRVETQQRELLSKEVEVALLKEKLDQQEIRMQQELKLLKLAAMGDRRQKAPRNKEIHIQELHVQVSSNCTDANGDFDPKMVQAATQAATAAALENAANTRTDQNVPTQITTNKPRPVAAAKPPPSTRAAAPQRVVPPPTVDYIKEAPSTEMKSNAAPLMTAAAVGATAAVMASNNNEQKDITFMASDNNVVAPKNNEKKEFTFSRNSDDDVSEEANDTFDTSTPWAPPGDDVAKPPARKPTPFVQKTGPLTTQGPQNPNPNRKDPSRASTKSPQPPGGSFNTAPSMGLPTKNQSNPIRGVPSEFDFDEAAPPPVPLEEDVTMATMDHRLLNPADDERSVSNMSMGNTVASSTYGEDRQKVVSRTLLDPYGDQGRYSGVVLRSTGMPHGLGRMVYEDDGRTYEGDWRHGRWHGYGRATFANGDSYNGEYRFDQRHGRGKYCWSDKRIYDGEFSEDKRHGKGTFEWPDGATYDGDFHQGQREGHGRYTFSDGGYYLGSWVDGRYEGFGGMCWFDTICVMLSVFSNVASFYNHIILTFLLFPRRMPLGRWTQVQGRMAGWYGPRPRCRNLS